jgi:DNA-directed RNA polymerase specialized sigma24 family protein
VADVFVAAIGALDRFDPVHGSAVAWLYGIANNVAANRWPGCRADGGH